MSLGSVPEEFLFYFTSRFPELLTYTYVAMANFRREQEMLPFYGDGLVTKLTLHRVVSKPFFGLFICTELCVR